MVKQENENEFSINGRLIGPGHPCYIIAEISANHNGSFEKAVDIIKKAKKSGADAIKIQTYTADSITLNCRNKYFTDVLNGTLWEGRNLYDLYSEASTPYEWQPKLKKIAEDLGMDFFSTPFDEAAVDFLEEMNVGVYKVASFEVNDHILLRKIAKTHKPVIMSTGMAELSDIESAVRVLRAHGATQIALLKCTSQYPAPPETMNIRTIPHLSETFNVVSGLSDHTLGTTVPVTAVALGGAIIEKHLCLSRQDPGPDSAFSLEPTEFKEMVDAVRVAEKALGTVKYAELKDDKKLLRRSLFVSANVAQGDVITSDHIRSVRPGHGLHTKHYDQIVGKTARRDLEMGTPVSFSMVE